MKKFDKNKPATLSEWLDIATAELASPGKLRVRWEVEAHFAEAVRGLIAQGKTQQIAESEALKQLGFPKQAAKNFTRSRLTVHESKYLAQTQKWVGNGWFLLLRYVVIGSFLAFLLKSGKNIWIDTLLDQFISHPLATLLFLAAAAKPLIIFLALKNGWLKRNSQLILFVEASNGFIFAVQVYLLGNIFELPYKDLLLFIVAGGCVAAVNVLGALNIRRKLKRALA